MRNSAVFQNRVYLTKCNGISGGVRTQSYSACTPRDDAAALCPFYYGLRSTLLVSVHVDKYYHCSVVSG